MTRAASSPSSTPPIVRRVRKTASESNESASEGRRSSGTAQPNPHLTREVLALAVAYATSSTKRGDVVEPEVPVQLTEADVRAISPRELRERLDTILLAKKADVGLRILQRARLFDSILPEVSELVGFGEGESRHKDVWRHTVQVVVQSVPRLAVRWGALLHDIGKPRTRSIAEDGSVHFLHHAEVGARMFTKLARREKLFDDDDELKETIRFLIYHHQRAHQYDESWTDSATRRFAREVGNHLDDLMALSRADMTTKRKEKRRRFLFQLKELTTRIDALLAEDNKPKPLPKGLGEALISEFRLPPSKLVGDIRKKLEAAVEAGELPIQAEFSVYLDFVRSNPERFGLPREA